MTMAGKTKKQGSRTPTPKQQNSMQPGPFKGHLGLKSSPYCTTSAKLTSQYMVMDHMSAHYRKVSSAKSTIDNTPPKAWIASQKVRDRLRREALQEDSRRRAEWLKEERSATPPPERPPSRESEIDRNEILEMMKTYQDEIDGAGLERNTAGHTTLDVHVPDSLEATHSAGNGKLTADQQEKLINKIISDTRNSPSKYHSPRLVESNIPENRTDTHRVTKSKLKPTSTDGVPAVSRSLSGSHSSTPRRLNKVDLLETNAHKFTDGKPFTPRTLKSNRTSKLSEFKYYTAPKRRPTERSEGPLERTQTPMTETSMDLMNETLMSRDMSRTKTPTGIPRLDISVDADHMNWLKDQARKADIRATFGSRREHDLGSTGGSALGDTQGLNHTFGGTRTFNGGMTASGYPRSPTMEKVDAEEEELKYLEFVTDVTNDVLERGIFSNRVLKSVFETHIEKRKHELKVSRMRELLAELQMDLGIPRDGESDDEESVGVGPTPREMTMTMKMTDKPPAWRTLSLLNKTNDNMQNLDDKESDRQLNGTLGPANSLMNTTSKVTFSDQESGDEGGSGLMVPKPRSRFSVQKRHGSTGSSGVRESWETSDSLLDSAILETSREDEEEERYTADNKGSHEEDEQRKTENGVSNEEEEKGQKTDDKMGDGEGTEEGSKNQRDSRDDHYSDDDDHYSQDEEKEQDDVAQLMTALTKADEDEDNYEMDFDDKEEEEAEGEQSDGKEDKHEEVREEKSSPPRPTPRSRSSKQKVVEEKKEDDTFSMVSEVSDYDAGDGDF